ncbi:MAG TPA: TonB family protein [Gemmatimonadaceae bacterium]|nr:TonB family protein [Gemmatimonadaceae bacterium]
MRPTLRTLAAAAFVTLALFLAPARAEAQSSDPIVAPEDLTKGPKLASPAVAASLITRAYPPQLRRAGIGGVVQLELTVDKTGKVEKNSVEVVVAAAPALGDAAKSVAERFEFRPAEVNGTPVRTRVLIPLTFVAR